MQDHVREQHVGRSPNERAEYVENVIQRRADSTLAAVQLPAPTLGSKLDPSDVQQLDDSAPRTQNTPYQAEPKQPGKLGAFVRERWPEILIMLLLVGLATKVFSLNREVGVAAEQADHANAAAESASDAVRQEAAAVEVRIEKRLDRLEDRVDALAGARQARR